MSPKPLIEYEIYFYAADIKAHLEAMYAENIMTVRFAMTKELMSFKLREGTMIYEHSLKMITLLEKLCNLNATLPQELRNALGFSIRSISQETYHKPTLLFGNLLK